MNKRKLHIWLPLLLSLALSAGFFISFKIENRNSGRRFFDFEKASILQEVMELIKNRYVDSVDLRKISDTSIQAILSKLDPHSMYIPANELEDINNDIEGSFYGIGIEFDVINDTLNVINVLNEGPALKAGIKTGDKILTVGEKSISGKKLSADSMRSILRGDRGSRMNIVIRRANKDLNITIQRDLIPVNSITAAYMIDNESGFIKINMFSTQTHHDFMIALEQLKNKGMKKLILDLRENGGGVLDEAVEIADEFLDGDKLITYTEGIHIPKKEYRCKRQGQFESGKLVVLSNDGSASASEVLMGALQDWDRALIIGRRSFGKGLVQEQYDLSDQGAIRLTVARYYSPSGRCIQRSYANGDKAYYDEIHDRKNGQNKEPKIDTTKYFKTSSGRKVYGGGGISPDVYVYSDSALYNESSKLAQLLNSDEIRRFAYQYYLKNMDLKTRYKNINNYISQFEISDEIWNDFLKQRSRDTTNLSGLSMNEKTIIKNSIKANISKILWDDSGYFQCYNTTDFVFNKALEIIR